MPRKNPYHLIEGFMPNCKSIAECAYCNDYYCQECTDAKNWQKYCCDECEEFARADAETQEAEDSEARNPNRMLL
jgi:hypothetical protein